MKSRKHEIIFWGLKGSAPIARIVAAINRLETQVDLYEIVDETSEGFAIILVRHSLLKSNEKRRMEVLAIVKRRFPTVTDVRLHEGDDWNGVTN
jgi:hypothetical protein